MALYISFESVRVRLVGKVRFTESEDDENKMSMTLANRLINEAESQVELDLSPRYAAPFVTDDGLPFSQLPERPTRDYLRTMCELQAVMRILETDFGAGSATDGEKYTKAIEKRYETMRDRLLMKKTVDSKDSHGRGWMFPPLTSLKLNYMNSEADDGYAGAVLVSSGSPSQGYARGQINSPGENFWNGVLSGPDDE